MALQVGETLGRYQLEQLVGQGGMAVVYRAVDSVLGRTVAVKVIRPAYTEDPQFLGRFLQEARVVASLDHPNILPLFDFGQEGGRPYLVLPYLPGGSLADRMGTQPQPLPLVVAWLIQLAGALDAAHARGVLHRDVKPGNVLVTNDGRLVLGDFGIARLAESTTRLTNTGMVVGTPIYMAPELARGTDGSPASDRYALAVMVYEMIAGLPPFHGTNALSVLHQQVHEPVPALAGRLPELPPAVDTFLRRALAKAPAARHPSARAMAEEMVQLLSAEQRVELSTLVWTGAPGAPDGSSSSSAESPTFVAAGRTMRLPPPAGGTSGPGWMGSSMPLLGGAAMARPSTSAVTAETPRGRRGSPLVWGLAAVAVIAAVLLFVPLDRFTGARGSGEPPAGEAAAGGEQAAATSPGSPAAGAPTASAAGGGRGDPAAGVSQGAPKAGNGAAGKPAPPPGEQPAVSEVALPVAGSHEPPLVVPAAGARAKLQLMRRPARRVSAAELQAMLDQSAEVANDPRFQRAGIAVVRDWLRGGLAHAGGESAAARSAAQGLRAAGGNVPWGIAWAATVFADGKPWDMAALYADPNRELAGLLEPELPGIGGKPRTALAAAYLSHLDGDHRGAMEFLRVASLDPLRDESEASGRALVAQFLAAEAAEANDPTAVRQYLPTALGQGRAPFAYPFALEMAAIARERAGPAEVAAMHTAACRLGVQQMCPSAVQPGLAQPAERPLLNPDRLGRRRRPGDSGTGRGPIGRPTPPGGRAGGPGGGG